jgi:hypothetical protein
MPHVACHTADLISQSKPLATSQQEAFKACSRCLYNVRAARIECVLSVQFPHGHVGERALLALHDTRVHPRILRRQWFVDLVKLAACPLLQRRLLLVQEATLLGLQGQWQGHVPWRTIMKSIRGIVRWGRRQPLSLADPHVDTDRPLGFVTVPALPCSAAAFPCPHAAGPPTAAAAAPPLRAAAAAPQPAQPAWPPPVRTQKPMRRVRLISTLQSAPKPTGGAASWLACSCSIVRRAVSA